MESLYEQQGDLANCNFFSKMWKLCCCCYCCCDKASGCWEYRKLIMASESRSHSSIDLIPFVQLPDQVWEEILGYFTFNELTRLRLVNRQLDAVCQVMLTRGSVRMLRNVTTGLTIKMGEMQRQARVVKESRVEAAQCLKDNLKLLYDTYGRFLQENRCCFIAGIILDQCKKIIIQLEKGNPYERMSAKLVVDFQEMCICAVDNFNETTIYYLQRPELDLPSELTPDSRKKVLDMHRIIRDQDDVIYYRKTMVAYLEQVVANFRTSLTILSDQFHKQCRLGLAEPLTVNNKAHTVRKKRLISSTSILDLPSKALIRIFSNLSYEELSPLREVCRMFNLVAQIVLNRGYYSLNSRFEKFRREMFTEMTEETNAPISRRYVINKRTTKKQSKVKNRKLPSAKSEIYVSSDSCDSPKESQSFNFMHPEYFLRLDYVTTSVTDLYACYLNGLKEHSFFFVAGKVLNSYERWVEQLLRSKNKLDPSYGFIDACALAKAHHEKINAEFFNLYNGYFNPLFAISKPAKARAWRTQKVDMCWYSKSVEVKRTRRWIEERDEEIDQLDLKVRSHYESICKLNQNVIFLKIKMQEEERRRERVNTIRVPASKR